MGRARRFARYIIARTLDTRRFDMSCVLVTMSRKLAMSPASNIEPVEDKNAFAKGIATTMGLAALGVAIAVAAFLATLWQLRLHHAGFGLVLLATAVYG